MGCTGSSLSLIHAQTLQTIPQTLRERGVGVVVVVGAGHAGPGRVNHSNTLMGTKTPITERTSELAAPFALHMEGEEQFGKVPSLHRTGETDITD